LWYVPSPQQVSKATFIYNSFSKEVWFACLIAFLGFLFVTFADKHLNKNVNPQDIMLETIAVNLNLPFKKPVTLFFSVFLILAYAYSLHTTTAFQSSLIVFLSSIPREKSISSMDELAQTKLKTIILDGSQYQLNQTRYELWTSLMRPGRVTYVPYLQISKVIAGEKAALLGPKLVMDLELQNERFFDEYGFNLVSSIPEEVMTIGMTAYMSPGHPMFHEMNRITLTLVGAGLTQHWGDVFVRRKFAKPQTVVRESFGLDNVESSFWIMGIGLMICIIVFILELIFSSISKHPKKKIGIRGRRHIGGYKWFRRVSANNE